MGSRAHAILWAQWRTVRNHLPRTNKGLLFFSVVLSAFWYLSFVALAISSAFLMSDPAQLPFAARVFPGGLLLAFLYWQLIPLLLVSTGSALDIKKLVAYPIPASELFWLEVLLRVTTGFEIIIVFLGTGVGLLLNPLIPKWAPLSLLIYAAFNLLVSAGVRDLLARLMARKVIREILVIAFVMAAGLPQLILLSMPVGRVKALLPLASAVFWPWNAVADLAQGRMTPLNMSTLLAWTAAAYAFGRWQFQRGLSFDVQEVDARQRSTKPARGWAERLFRFPALLFPDPLAALIEKELRLLSRSSRFRLVFLMGFSFGLLIWLPATFGPAGSRDSWMAHNYLTLVCVYALLLLSDVLFWNVFGFDRSAAQIYFIAPITFETVLRAKNFTAVIFIALDITLVAILCTLFRLPISLEKVAEAYAVTFTVTMFLMAVGNLSSAHNPKAVDPSKSFRTSAGCQTQAVLMLFFPIALIPAGLAYAARYAFQTELAFFGTLAVAALFGAVVHRIATESAVAAIGRRKEAIITALSAGQGPVG